MKTRFLSLAGLFIVTTLLLGSCIQKNYYDAEPTGNNNNNNTNYYTFDEEFNGGDMYNWGFTSAADSAYASITGGSYQYVDYSTTKSHMSVVSTSINTTSNFTAKTKIKSNNTMGLIFCASALNNGYAFFLDTAGYYAVYQEGSGSIASTPIIPFTSGAPYAVKNGWNTLEVDQTNGTWAFFINGTRVASISARTISGSSFGFKVLPGTVGYADYLQVNSN